MTRPEENDGPTEAQQKAMHQMMLAAVALVLIITGLLVLRHYGPIPGSADVIDTSITGPPPTRPARPPYRPLPAGGSDVAP